MSSRWISLSKTDSQFVFATTHSLSGSAQWAWIEKTVRQEFECFDDDALDLLETDDGRDVVTVNDRPAVEIHHCRMNGYAPSSQNAADQMLAVWQSHRDLPPADRLALIDGVL